MSARIELRTAPHVKSPRTVETIMRTVVLSLLPICLFFIYQYGISAAALLLVVTGACLVAERASTRAGGQSGDIGDWSATITGLLLALSLPPGFPLWMGAIAGLVAIFLGKSIFGGLGRNVFNPALVGRAFVQAAFPTAIASYTPSFLPGRFGEFIPSSLALPFMQPPATDAWVQAMQIDAIASATPLSQFKFEGVVAGFDQLLTSLGGHLAVGPSPLLILACGLFLAYRRYLDWRIPVAVLGSAVVLGWALHAFDPVRFADPGFVLLSGGLMLGAIYMATDMATSPVTPKGALLYGALIGVLTVVIRDFSGLPEGVMYAILIANAAAPLIERVTQPTPFGRGPSSKVRRATYPLTPSYISREEHHAVVPEKGSFKPKVNQ